MTKVLKTLRDATTSLTRTGHSIVVVVVVVVVVFKMNCRLNLKLHICDN